MLLRKKFNKKERKKKKIEEKKEEKISSRDPSVREENMQWKKAAKDAFIQSVS